MLNLFNKKNRLLRKALLLIGVYSLHLVFLQALMAAAPLHKDNSSFKPLFTHHGKNQNNQPPNHPAVTYYTQLIKQGKDVGRALSVATPEVNYSDASYATPLSALAVTFNRYPGSPVQPDRADDTFKLYRLQGVFLI